MPIEPVKIDKSRLSEEILESVTCLNNAINQYNIEKNFATCSTPVKLLLNTVQRIMG